MCPAADRRRHLEVRLQVGLPQALAGAVGQRGDGVGGDAEHGRHLGGRATLDLGVPQHGLPALGQVGERPGDQLLVLAGHGGAGHEHGVEILGDLVGARRPGLFAGAVVEGVADRGEQVRTEGELGATPVAQGAQDAGERLRHQVVGVGARTDEAAGRGAGGADVTLVELGVRGVVAAAGGEDEVGVGGKRRSRRWGLRSSVDPSPHRSAGRRVLVPLHSM